MIENPDLLLRALDHITKNPDEWDQASWWRTTSCGTKGCLAGWIVFLGLQEQGLTLAADDIAALSKDPWGWQCQAARLLGATPEEVGAMFDADNTLDALRAWVSSLTGNYRALLDGSDFQHSTLDWLYLPGASLNGSSWLLTDLTSAFMDGASLKRATFTKTRLGFTSFRNADLSGAIFAGANLHETDFTGADLTGALFVECSRVETAIFDSTRKGKAVFI